MSLIPDHLKALMLSNGKRRAQNEDFDPFPIVKLFAPWAAMTWLLSDLDPSDADIAFGVIDLGNGFPDLGTVRISDIEAMRGPLGLAVERDVAFLAEKTLSAYAYDASQRGAIVT